MESSRYWGKNANLAPTVQNINIYRSVDQLLDAGQQGANLVTTKGLTSHRFCFDKNGLRLDRQEAVE